MSEMSRDSGVGPNPNSMDTWSVWEFVLALPSTGPAVDALVFHPGDVRGRPAERGDADLQERERDLAQRVGRRDIRLLRRRVVT